jgi:UDP-2,3-diacylglucosamine pyrophosphatase LpxH
MKYTQPDNIIDIDQVWWKRQYDHIQEQAEQVKEAIYDVLDDGHECIYEPEDIYITTGRSNFQASGYKATWTALILYVDGQPAFTLNVHGDRRYGANVVNCGRLIRGRLEFFYCDNIEEIVSAARQYTKNHVLPKLVEDEHD